MSRRVFPLGSAVQCYAWGKPGSSSEVASLSKTGNPDFQMDESKPYAELWMGTHPKGPSMLLEKGTPLSEWVAENPDCLGTKVQKAFPKMAAGQLPFLFKVLSVNKSLSIQAHPNKPHAEQLHQEKPDKYPDPNHKPEMAIALTRFKAMCGFRPKEEILIFLQRIPELAEIVGEAVINSLAEADTEALTESAVQKCFTALMNCSPDVVRGNLAALISRINSMESEDEAAFLLRSLLLRLNAEFPGDVGCFCIYFLNVLDLEPGQAIFLEANLPHAYLEGDCIECMACSDNVVRAGLTPKFKDVDVLCSMLNYQCLPASENLFPSRHDDSNPHVTVFDPPIPDFTVAKLQIPSGVKSTTLSAVDGASILLVIEGEGQGVTDASLALCRGSVLFIAANETLPINISSAGMLMFRAFCSV